MQARYEIVPSMPEGLHPKCWVFVKPQIQDQRAEAEALAYQAEAALSKLNTEAVLRLREWENAERASRLEAIA